MNSKAQRNEISFPLLLNMSDNRPAIHSNFQSAERINAPYQNEMLSPHYKKEVKSDYLTTFDKNDNIYEIHDKALYRNGEKLFDVDNRKFVQYNVTEEFKDYLGFDYDDEYNLASLTANDDLSFTISYKGTDTRINPLYTTGRVICARLRCLNNRPIVVIVYATSADTSAHILIHDGTRSFNRTIQWCTQKPKTTYANASLIAAKTMPADNIYPIIHISEPIAGTLAISLATNFAEQLYTRKEAYYTFISDFATGNYIDGTKAQPKNRTETAVLNFDQYDTFTFTNDYVTETKSYDMYQDDEGVWKNKEDNEPIPNQENIKVEIVEGTVNVGGKDYQLYTSNYNTITYNLVCNKTQQSDHKYSIYTKVQDTENTTAFSSEQISLVAKAEGWYLTPNEVIIEKHIIDTSDSNKEYQFDENNGLIITQTYSQSATIGWVVGPNFFLDDGSIRSWFTTEEITTTQGTIISGTWVINSSTPNAIIENAKLTSVDYTAGNFDFTTDEYHRVGGYSCVPRNNCISVGQNFWSSSAMLCAAGMQSPYKRRSDPSTAETISNTYKYVSYSGSNAHGMRYYAGVFPNSDYTFYTNATAASTDVAWYQTGGFRIPATRGNWNILYYNAEDSVSDIQGLSWSETHDMMGTLVAPWNKVDSSFYIVFTEDFMIYKDFNGRIWKIAIEEGNEVLSLFDNKYIVINTTSYWNCYDAINQVKYHYATDYNNRVKFGVSLQYWSESTFWEKKDSRLNITSINSAFNNTLKPMVSLQAPYLASSFQKRKKDYIDAPHCQAPSNDSDVQLIDVYYQAGGGSDAETDEPSEWVIGGQSLTGAKYKFSILSQAVQARIRNSEQIGVVYTGVSTNYSPDIFAKYINGAGNNDFLDENGSAYPIAYNNLNQPVFVYLLQGEALNTQAFFVIQGQYYAVMNEKLYALSYYNGYIQNQDAVIDVRGMYFVGNTPEIAFFWSEKKRAFYSYTGDGILTQIFDATKYSLEKFSFKYYYDETVQSIWIPTSAGLLCFGTKNTYLMEDITNVKDILFTADYTYIIQEDGYTILKYYYEDGFEPIPIELETSFYGAGNNEVSTIDRWQITLFDERHPKIDVKLSVRSITDVTVKAEDKTFHIGENDWDKWSHSILLSYSPKLIKGQGIRLYVESPAAIQKIVPHVADQGHVSTTRFQM